MKRFFDFLWPVLGLIAVIFSGWLLYQEIRSLSASDILASLAAIPLHRWVLAGGSTLIAYGALAWYDRIALMHLGKPLGWGFISVVSFTTYALSHNIGASVFSGAAVRYRAYSTKGLTAAEIGVLVALCSFTFLLGTVMLGGFVLMGEPELISRLFDIPVWPGRVLGFAFLACVALYVLGSLLGLKPLTIGSFHIYYPRPAIVVRQLFGRTSRIIGCCGDYLFCAPVC